MDAKIKWPDYDWTGPMDPDYQLMISIDLESVAKGARLAFVYRHKGKDLWADWIEAKAKEKGAPIKVLPARETDSAYSSMHNPDYAPTEEDRKELADLMRKYNADLSGNE